MLYCLHKNFVKTTYLFCSLPWACKELGGGREGVRGRGKLKVSLLLPAFFITRYPNYITIKLPVVKFHLSYSSYRCNVMILECQLLLVVTLFILLF